MRRLLVLAVIAVTLFLLLGRCNLCLLTQGHAKHDTEAVDPESEGATLYPTTFQGTPMTVYRFGNNGPPVLLLHELPGFSRETIRLAQMIAAHGYQVHAPLLFGKFGETKSGLLRLRQACGTHFWHCLSGDATPLVGYVREQVVPKMEGKPFVAIGMCLTGNAPPQLLADPTLAKKVAGVVMSQPAMPFPLTKGKMAEIGLTSIQISEIVKSGRPILAFRFTEDCLSPAARMLTFERTFRNQITVYQLDSGRCNHDSTPHTAHAVLTQEYRPSEPLHPTNEAVRRLLTFLDAQLKGEPRS